MQIIYMLLSIISVVYLIFKARKVDYFTIYIFSIIIYYFPAYLGGIYINNFEYIPISNTTYLILILNLSINLFIMILYDFTKRKTKFKIYEKTLNNFYDNKAVFLIAVITLILNLVSMHLYKGISGNFDKVALLQDSNRITEYSKYFSLFIFVYAFTNRGKHINSIRIIAIISMVRIFMLGHRSFLVIGIICIAFVFLENKNVKNILEILTRYKKFVIIAIVFLVFIFFVKNVFAAFMDGNYELVISRLSDKNYYIKTLLQSEPNAILNNLDSVVKYNMKYDLVSYFLVIFSASIPFLGSEIMNALNLKTFEYLLQINFNSQFDEGIGLGSTFLGECFSTGGLFFVILICILVGIMIIFIQKINSRISSPIVKTWLIIFLTYTTFYISRNSFVFILVSSRAYLYIVIVTLILKNIIKGIYKKFGTKIYI
ncbi:TPA: oligosaccharide repeat unit polymerase [Clostridium perfringens]|nr:oligosaccharide repeat unit polymerase [Clostridium perfringens]HAT4284985.1 oligosaccharide repeat unit polymerase [Clostridium perfringens]